MAADLTSKVHQAYLEQILHTGRPLGSEGVAARLAVPISSVHEALRTLETTHGAVLHPHVCEPWIMHPFSLSPSATWVEGPGLGWWAPCMWCAFGIAGLVEGPVTVHTRVGGEAEDLDIHVEGGVVRERELWVHFAVPPHAAWDNVHHFCATVLPFRSQTQVAEWCERHGIPQGSVIPVQQCADLGREWYRTYADSDWRKWTIREAAGIFESVGLVDGFWTLPESDNGF